MYKKFLRWIRCLTDHAHSQDRAGKIRSSRQTHQDTVKIEEIYQYSPLKAEPKELRLLTLLPGSASSDIFITVEHHPFSAPEHMPVYEALSYVWGAPVFQKAIWIAGVENASPLRPLQKLMVTPNLYDALQGLRHEQSPRVMWIDAICINQADITERSTKVASMGEIYSLASQVVVWLGPTVDDSDLAMQVIAEMGSQVSVSWETRDLELLPGGKAEYVHGVFDEVHTNSTQLAIQHIFLRPWFQRLWIWQEILLAQSASVVCGPICIPWNTFAAAIRCIIHQLRRVFQLSPELPGFRDWLYIAEGLTVKLSRRSLRKLLELTEKSLYSNPHDRIYALLGLVDKRTRNLIVPDYEKSLCDLFREVTRHYIESRGSLDILKQCSHIKKQPGLESWVPDWTTRNLFGSVYHGQVNHGRAAGRSPAEVSFHGSSIRVSGVRFSTLKSCSVHVGSRLLQGRLGESDLFGLWKWEPPDLLNTLYLNGEPMVDAYSTTLICNDNGERRESGRNLPTRAEYRNAFLHTIYSGREKVQHSDTVNTSYKRILRRNLSGRIFVWTENGYMGMAPATAQVGDIICVFLGCQTPILIRCTNEKSLHYIVIGSCYVHGLMDSEALLGPLPQGWRAFFSNTDNYQFVSPDGKITDQDPRLWPLMSDSEIYYKNKPFDGARPDKMPIFRRKETLDGTSKDPRLSSSNLKAGGVKIQTFTLV